MKIHAPVASDDAVRKSFLQEPSMANGGVNQEVKAGDTSSACIGLNNIALGFLLGLAMAWCFQLGVFRVEERGDKA